MRKIINYTDKEIESSYKLITSKLPKLSIGQIGYLLKQQKTTKLLKDFINKEIEHK